MKQKSILLYLVLALALVFTGCGGQNVQPEEVQQPSLPQENMVGAGSEDNPQQTGPGVTASGTAAETDGRLVYTVDYDQGILDGSGESGWFVTSWLAKGYGTRYYAVNPETGLVIEGEEGAPVVLCGDGIVRFVWKDVSGNEVSADTVYFMGDAPQTYTLYARIYGQDGQLREEREVLTWTQTAEDPYFSQVLPAMERIVAELGGGSVEGRMSVLSVAADGADAVIYGQDGGELIRLPGVDASGIFAYASQDGTFVSVYRPDSDQTEFYRF